MQRAETYEEIKPLIDLCKAGKLFEVQEWIASGKTVRGTWIMKARERESKWSIYWLKTARNGYPKIDRKLGKLGVHCSK